MGDTEAVGKQVGSAAVGEVKLLYLCFPESPHEGSYCTLMWALDGSFSKLSNLCVGVEVKP